MNKTNFKIIIISFLFIIGCQGFTYDFQDYDTNIFTMSAGERYLYVQGIKNIITPNKPNNLYTKEFKELVITHKRDKNYTDNFYAVQAGYTKYNNNKISAINNSRFDAIKMYSVQEPQNQRVKYYYSIFGNLKYIGIFYENYPYYPYIERKYNKKGKLLNTIFYKDNDTQIIFSNLGLKANVLHKGTKTDTMKF